MKKKSKIIISCVAAFIIIVAAVFFIYVSGYSRATAEALDYLNGTAPVSVDKIEQGYLLDGPGTDRAMIFYPGGKVEETAYLPLLEQLAENGIDCFLVQMPFHLAIFDSNKAASIIHSYAYDDWYLAGHSLGGVCASMYVAKHPEECRGLIMLASYPTEKLPDNLQVMELYGSEDMVLDKQKLADSAPFLPADAAVKEIPGANHAQFGNYGEQRGDGVAAISRQEQQNETVSLIVEYLD